MSGVRHADTHVEYELDTETWLGPFAGTATYEQAQEIEALLVSSGLHARAFPDLRPAQWSKLIFNATVNTVAALTDLPHVGAFAARDAPSRPRPPRPRPDGRGQGGCRRRGRRAARGSVGDERARRPARRDARRRGPLRPRAVDARGRPRRPRRPRSTSSPARSSARPSAHGVPVPLHTAMYRLVKARESRMRVAVIGCGAVGSLFAANLGHARRRRGLGVRPLAGARRRDQRERPAALRRRRRRRAACNATADPAGAARRATSGSSRRRAMHTSAAMAATAHAFGRRGLLGAERRRQRGARRRARAAR